MAPTIAPSAFSSHAMGILRHCNVKPTSPSHAMRICNTTVRSPPLCLTQLGYTVTPANHDRSVAPISPSVRDSHMVALSLTPLVVNTFTYQLAAAGLLTKEVDDADI